MLEQKRRRPISAMAEWWLLDVPWEARVPEDYDGRRQRLLSEGLLCVVRFWREPCGIFGLEVAPLEPALMLQPGNRGTPWHISVDNGDAAADELSALFPEPVEVRLRFSWISWGAVGQLAEDCPIGGHPAIRRMFAEGYYKYKSGLHISF
jgi:hypothetical protein